MLSKASNKIRYLQCIGFSYFAEITLSPNEYFGSIKNLKIKFSYFDYKNSKYVDLDTIIIKDTFESGIPKIHRNQIRHLPTDLILNNYYKRGEFIISEIVDFEIPKLKTTYQKLLSNIIKKSIPVVYSDPQRDTVYYVALEGRKKKLNEIIGNIFGTQFAIDNNKLIQIDGLSNNLDSYSQLIDLSTNSRDGQWYVITTPIFGNVVSHEFETNDAIGLHYVTGDILASQIKNRQSVTKVFYAHLNNTDQLYLEKVGTNSELYIRLDGKRYWGATIKYTDYMKTLPFLLRARRKHTPDLQCEIYTTSFPRYQVSLDFIEHDNVLSQIFLTVGGQKYSIKQLIDAKRSKVFVTNYDIYLHIKRLSDLLETKYLDKVDVSIMTKAGFKLVPIGIHMKYYSHENICLEFIKYNSLPISTSSMNFENWRNKLHKNSQTGTIEDVPNYQNFDLEASIILFDYHN